MKSKFIFGVIISVILIVGNQLVIQRALNMKKQDSRLINLAGRQRMLSQKIALEFHKISINTSPGLVLKKYLFEWKIAHEKVLMDSVEINKSLSYLPKTSTGNNWIQDLSTKIKFIENEINSYKKTNTINLEAVDQNQDGFLLKMDSIVDHLVAYSDKKLTNIIILEIILACLSILVIFLEVRYIYYPQAQQLKNSLDVIQLKNKELEQFNYIASHDLKEPLRTVSNYVQIIKEDYSEKLNDDVNRHLNTIDKATERMSVLIKSLLDYSKLGKDRKPVLIDCNVLVNDVIADLFKLIETNKAQITINHLPILLAYETELRQVFQNLISNAIKFKKKDSVPEIKIGYINNKTTHEFYVSDNGIGIEPKHFDRIFHMFQRLNKSQDFEGHGIGLANCKKIIEIHGGELWVESEFGKGSTFKFTIQKSL